VRPLHITFLSCRSSKKIILNQNNHFALRILGFFIKAWPIWLKQTDHIILLIKWWRNSPSYSFIMYRSFPSSYYSWWRNRAHNEFLLLGFKLSLYELAKMGQDDCPQRPWRLNIFFGDYFVVASLLDSTCTTEASNVKSNVLYAIKQTLNLPLGAETGWCINDNQPCAWHASRLHVLQPRS